MFLVDDDVGVLKALTTLLDTSGYEVRPFSSPQEFLSRHDPSIPGCAVFDVAMRDLDGLALHEVLVDEGIDRPVIFITGAADIPTSVRAMKAGAVDFLTKPVSEEQLLEAIARGMQRDAESRQRHHELELIHDRLATLTQREREVLSGQCPLWVKRTFPRVRPMSALAPKADIAERNRNVR